MIEAGKTVRIAVDAMGGDFAPEEIIKGAILAARKDNVEIALVGHIDILEKRLDEYKFSNNSNNLHIRCVDAKAVIEECESPALAIRRKPDSSIAVAEKMVKSGEVDAFVSAGSSGAITVGAIKYIGMLEGIGRPAIIASLGSFVPGTVIVDFGANVDCKPHQLLAFGIAGSIFVKKALNVDDPTVALLSTGVEEGKGNELVRESYSLLKNSGLNFVGNIEGNDILKGRANVIICDGFMGNVLMKFYEGIGDYALEWIGRKLRRYPPTGTIAKAMFNRLIPIKKMTIESERDGGGILWGIDGVVKIAHGNSRAPQIACAIASAKGAVESDIVGCLREELMKLNNGGKL